MKFGSREICDVVLKAKTKVTLGNKTFYRGEPVLYFDSLKTSSLEGTSSTVYATGGKGNPRLIAWEGDKTTTFTMEDALISKESMAILMGAGIVEASAAKPIYVHKTAQVELAVANTITIENEEVADTENSGVYIMVYDDNMEDLSEPCIPADADGITWVKKTVAGETTTLFRKVKSITAGVASYEYETSADGTTWSASTETAYNGATTFVSTTILCYGHDGTIPIGSVVLVDFYVPVTSKASVIEISADKFGGNFYLEASTLFRNQQGVDMAAEIIIPNCDIQSNFNITMSNSGDPSTFTFTIDAFPDYTKFNKTEKVLAAIQMIEDAELSEEDRVACVEEE